MEKLLHSSTSGSTTDRPAGRPQRPGLRVLFAALSLPDPPTNGQALRNLAILQALVAEGHQITLVSFADANHGKDWQHLRGETLHDVELVPLPRSFAGKSDYFSRLRGLASVRPHGVRRFESEAMKAVLHQRLDRGEFDLLICDDVYQMENLPIQSPVCSILNKHDLTHVIVRRYLKYEKNPFKLAYGWMEYAKLRRWEAGACSRFDQVWTCSVLDREQLRLLGSQARFAVVPNVIDVNCFLPADSNEQATVLFAGSMDWLPNRDAVEFFVSRLLPLVWEQKPGFKFVVAGRNPPAALLQRFRQVKQVVFTGEVADMREEIAKATVCVVPLRIGSGTRLKILEAAAMAKPVVSTSIGAEGLDFAAGKEIVIEDDPARFAQAVARLLANPDRRQSLGQAARAHVERNYSLAALRRSLRVALEPFVASRDRSVREGAHR